MRFPFSSKTLFTPYMLEYGNENLAISSREEPVDLTTTLFCVIKEIAIFFQEDRLRKTRSFVM